MSYKIFAEIIDPQTGERERGTGTLTDHERTRQKALNGARQLREQGFQVTLTDHDGNPVEEAELGDADRT